LELLTYFFKRLLNYTRTHITSSWQCKTSEEGSFFVHWCTWLVWPAAHWWMNGQL